ncbi:MAG: hypothetical protein QM654_14665 [Dysgonamonadaceae bacterium]
MISIANTHKLIDYVLFNSCSLSSCGLYNGKAGISLCLFETARYLQDEYLEEQAYKLLQESLLAGNEDVGFENGLAGIGYVLLYLIRHEFIEADFDELFGKQAAAIAQQLDKAERSDDMQFFKRNIKIACFLNLLYPLHVSGRQLSAFSKAFAHILEEYILKIRQKQYAQLKMELNALLGTCLNISSVCAHFSISPELLDNYMHLWKENKLISDFTIAYNLMEIVEKNNSVSLKEAVRKNLFYALKNMHPQTMTIAEQINMLLLLKKKPDLYKDTIAKLEDYMVGDENTEEDAFEKKLLSAIRTGSLIAGYESGISRLLLYRVYCSSNDARSRLIML